MAKFKVGYTVRVIDNGDKRTWLNHLNGKKSIIKNVYKCANPDTGCYDIGEDYIIPEDRLELVKPKFNIKDYPGKYVMHVTTEEEANIFCEYSHSVGEKWRSGDSYVGYTSYGVYKSRTCYNFNTSGFGHYDYYKNDGYTILEFNDFDWSDFTMKKEFTNYIQNVMNRKDAQAKRHKKHRGYPKLGR